MEEVKICFFLVIIGRYVLLEITGILGPPDTIPTAELSLIMFDLNAQVIFSAQSDL